MSTKTTTDRPTYDSLVAAATEEIIRHARTYMARGWPVEAAIKEADDLRLSDFHARHATDLFAAFEEYRDAEPAHDDRDEWPAVARDALVSTIEEWTRNGPNAAHSAALATADAMVRADARERAHARLGGDVTAEADVSLYRFKDDLEAAGMVFGYDGVLALAEQRHRDDHYSISIYHTRDGIAFKGSFGRDVGSPGDLQDVLWRAVMDESDTLNTR